MLKNYLKVALRTVRRQKGFAAINISGLALGLACCLCIGVYIWGELSYDRHHEHADRIYRVALDRVYPTSEVKWAPVAPAVAAGVADTYPEVAAATRITMGRHVVRLGEQRIVEEGVLLVDPSFLDVFTVPFLSGDAQHTLHVPEAVVLTETAALKYFGDSDPVGQSLVVDDTLALRVTGVVADPPATSHFTYNFLRPLDDGGRGDVWDTSFFFYTYIRLHEGASAEALEAKFPEMARARLSGGFDSPSGYDEWLASGNAYRYFLQPLTDIHLHSDLKWELAPNGNVAYVYLFSVVALFILLLAVINFVNLATARSAERAREVGVRKVLGSSRQQIVGQFLAESILMSMVALGIAVVASALALPALSDLVGRPLSLRLFGGSWLAGGLLGLALLIGVAAGTYPALFLSAFRPAVVLKSKRGGARRSRLRDGLVVMQFAVSVVLIVGTVVVYRQLGYMLNEDLGFDQEQVVLIEGGGQLRNQNEAFRDEVLRQPGVVSVAFTGGVPGDLQGASTFRPADAPELELNMAMAGADEAYLQTLGMELAAGRDFRTSDFADTVRTAILNETAARQLGWGDDAVGRALLDGQSRSIDVVGVVEDFHFESLRQPIRPLILRPFRSGWGPVAVRTRADAVPATLAGLEQRWTRFVPAQPFVYTFLDDTFAAQYASERVTGTLVTLFTVLAVLIACLGLFGLAAFMAEQRTKEIGVRKVLGATVASIVALMSRDFLMLVVVAIGVAAPVAYFGMQRWLADFAYHIDLGVGVFLLAGALAVGIALLTVAYHAVRAAIADPVKSLRYE